MDRVRQVVDQTPPVTRCLIGGMLSVALLETTMSPLRFAWIPGKFWAEPWRLITSVMYHGPVGISLVANAHSFWSISQTLEETVYRTRRSYAISVAILSSIVLALAPVAGIKYPGPALSSALSYVWSRQLTEQRVVLLFFELPAEYMFWIQLVQILIFGDMYALPSVLLGFVAGHAVFLAQSTLPLTTAPYRYFLEQKPGKNVRDLLINAFAQTASISDRETQPVRECIRTLHIASMLIDDVEDGATTRRGAPAAHKVFGDALTINCSHYIVFQAMQKLDPSRHAIFLEEILALHRGQGLDIFWRDMHVIPSQQQYLDMVKDKTGGLLRMAVRLMGAEQFVALADLLGILYQIQDDLLNLTSGEYLHDKGFCEDLTEGKYSFPVIHHLSNTENRELDDILRLHTTDRDIKMRALELMRSTNSFEYTRNQVLLYQSKALELVKGLDGDVTALTYAIGKIVMV